MQLNKQAQREKDPVALEQGRSKTAYAALKLDSQRFNQAYSDGNPELLYRDSLNCTVVVEIVGPKGADTSIGPHKFSILRAAVKNYVVITDEMPMSMPTEVRLSPHELTFAQTSKLTFSYEHCSRPTSLFESVACVDENQAILGWPTHRDNIFSGLVNGWLKHSSTYPVAHRSRL